MPLHRRTRRAAFRAPWLFFAPERKSRPYVVVRAGHVVALVALVALVVVVRVGLELELVIKGGVLVIGW